jgi:hypothetical protein
MGWLPQQGGSGMAVVFVSHAHGDEALARRVTTLLRDGLGLQPGDFFVSSQGGRGVAPAANIREEIRKALAAARALIVLATPASAGSPWVWIETGIRLGRPDTSNPLFLVPSERFVKKRLLDPVADLRCICLDREDDLHELVRAVGNAVGRPPRDVLDYGPSLAELARTARSAYSPSGERKLQVETWLRRHAALLAIAAAAVVGVLVSSGVRLASARAETVAVRDELARTKFEYTEAMNRQLAETASQYLVLKGVVRSGTRPIPGAIVTASQEVSPSPGCEEPLCTSFKTTSAGEFILDLSRIQVQNRDDVLLVVRAPGFEAFSKHVNVDVRAMDVGLPAHTVDLEPVSGTSGGGP